jgi:hypothetical protein
MSYEDIGNAIYSMLGGITEFDIVYNYEPNELKKFPCATVSALSHANTFNDTAANRREFLFVVRVYFRRDMTDYENVMRKVVDLIITTIEADPSLTGACDFAEPTESKWLFQEREVPVRVCEVTINAIKRLNR